MLVKSPDKKKKTKRNLRKVSNGKRKKRKKHSKKNNGKKDSNEKLPVLNVKPWKIIVGVIIVGILGVLYLRHVFATKELLSEVERLEQQYEQIKRKHDYYKLTYERMTGPKAIFDKARAAGFIDTGAAEKIIEVEPIE